MNVPIGTQISILLMEAYGAGVHDTLRELAKLPYPDRNQILAQYREDIFQETHVMCEAGKHWMIRTERQLPCPWCFRSDGA